MNTQTSHPLPFRRELLGLAPSNSRQNTETGEVGA